jgi:hypothetical protein
VIDKDKRIRRSVEEVKGDGEWWRRKRKRKRRGSDKDGNNQPKQSRRPDVQRRETMKTGGNRREMRDRGGQENGSTRGDVAGVREGEDVELLLKRGVVESVKSRSAERQVDADGRS